MPYSEKEIGDNLFKGLDQLRMHSDFGEEWLHEYLEPLLVSYHYFVNLYVPDETLKARIDDYIKWCASGANEDQGQLMEEISFLAFRCCKDAGNIKSYQSFAPQYDLVVSGTLKDGFGWRLLMDYLRLSKWDTVIVEAKNTDKKVNVEQFTRLCWIIDHMFSDLAGLGVFFSRTGATGFPTAGSRQRSLKASRAAQIIFHARTGKYVIIIDHDDILKLSEPGALPLLIKAKMRDVEEVTGLPVDYQDDNWRQIDLPEHLNRHVRKSS